MKQNFEIVFGFKSDQHNIRDFFFSLFLLPSSFSFLAYFFFFCWAFSRLQFGGNALGKALRILALGERVSPCTKLSLTIKTDNVTSGRRDVDPHG